VGHNGSMLGDLSPLDAFADGAMQGQIPDPSLEVMRLCVLDWAICGLGAQNEPIVSAMMQHGAGGGSGGVEGGASVFFAKSLMAQGGPATLPARMAAMVNGTLSHALDFDDTHFGHIGHVSTVVVPAALAVAEETGADFDTFVRAARIGAEVACRVGLWLGRSHYQAGWHQTGTAGAYGAACAAALVMGAPVAASLTCVAGMAAGQKAQFGTVMKPVNAGLAAAHGVEAAQMAKAGLSGSADVFAAVLNTQAGEGNTDGFADLGTRWVFDSVTHKYHACCHGTHAMIEALLSLGALDATDIAAIAVKTHPRWMSVCNKPAPATWLEGKFSYRFLAAMTVLGGKTIGPDPERYFPLEGQPRTNALMNKITVQADDSLAETACDLTVTLTNGQLMAATFDLATPDPLDMRRNKLVQKGHALVTPAVTRDLLTAIDGRDLAALIRAIRGD